MQQTISPLAGKPAASAPLVDIPALLAAYDDLHPDAGVAEQRVHFGTNGHRGSALKRSFNAAHIRAITQAICDWRRAQDITGPLYLGIDTHALSQPAFETALGVLAANSVITLISAGGEFTPTPAVSHAILTHNRGRETGLADGIVITPSHNPPTDGGLKYNPPNGGPAVTSVTRWMEDAANAYLEHGLQGVRELPYAVARRAATTHEHDFLHAYVDDLANVIDFDAIRAAGIRMGVDPLGGAGVHYWRAIAERYAIPLTVLSEEVDSRFAFMTRDVDGLIRMDPSSAWAMQRLIAQKDRFDIAWACDTDHDRHGIVTPDTGLMPSNHYLTVLADALLRHRPHWPTQAAIGKTVVSTSLIDRVATQLNRSIYEVPVGFKWFSQGLLDGSLGVGCEESAGATVLRRDGGAWTTDKDGIVPGLLAAEITARGGRSPSARYAELARALGTPFAARIQAPATPAQKHALAALQPSAVAHTQLAGEPIRQILNRAPGNGEPIGGVKVVTDNGWFAARPSGTEDIYKIYAESFRDERHLGQLLDEAQQLVDKALKTAA